YPVIHPPSQEINEEVFQAKEDLMKSIQTFLEEFNYIPFEEKPKILLQAWYKFFAIQHAQPEDSNELFQKLLEDLKELAEYVNSLSRDRSIFFDDNKDHSEYLENSSNEIDASNSNQEKEKPPQDSDIGQLIKEECCIEVCEDQKQNMEITILELFEICRQKELYCMHDNVDDLIESALNFKLLSINSQRLNKKEREVKNVVEQPAERRTRIEKSLQNFRVIHKSSISLKNASQISSVHAIAPILSTKEPEYLLSMGYEHPNTTPETESDEIIKSGVEELVPIPNECEVTSEDKRDGDVLVCEDSPICDDHSEIYSDSNNDDDISSDDDAFEDIEYVEASLPDPEIERLINVVKNDMYDDSTNDPLLEEVDLFLAFDNSIPPGIENFSDDSEGDIRFLEELLIDDSILFPNNESSESDFDNSLFPRPLRNHRMLKIPSGEIKVHIEVLSVLWGNRLPIRMVRRRCLGKDYAQIVKNQSKPSNIEHKIGSLHQKPNQQAFFSSNQAMKPKCQKNQSSGSILAKYPKSKSTKNQNQSARAKEDKFSKL
nr:hypothetical protein [Tanacetum cinerariifolium]